MKLRLIPLLLIIAALMLLMGCSGDVAPPAQTVTSTPTPTQVPPAPTATLAPAPTAAGPEVGVKGVPVEVVKDVIVEKIVEVVVTATPTPTSTPTQTPTATPMPTATARPAPTPTSRPTPTPTPMPVPTSTPVPEVCPVGATTHAESMGFQWEGRPMRSGEIANIAISPTDPKVMYLAIEVNALSMYKSIDGGRSWTLVHSGDHAKDVAVHPLDPEIVFYSDVENLWRTSGGQFEKVLQHQYGHRPGSTSLSTIAIAPGNPSIVYTAVQGSTSTGEVRGHLFKSEDGGESFAQLNSPGLPTRVNVLLVDPQDESRLFAGSNNGIYLSTDSGASFSLVTSAQDVADLHSIDGETLFAATTDGILHSTNGGVTWRKQTQGLPSPITLRVRVASSEPRIVWATTIDGVARSTDGGSTWEDASGAPKAGGLPARNLQALAVHPQNPNSAFVATETFLFSVRSEQLFRSGQYYSQGIYRTQDGGETWIRSDNGIVEYYLEDVTAHPSRPFEVWAAQQRSRGYYRSRDTGQSWSLSPSKLAHYPMRLVFFPNDPDAVASTSNHTGQNFGITFDSGVTWAMTSEQTFYDSLGDGASLFDVTQRQGGALHLHGLAIDPSNPQIIYVGTVHEVREFDTTPLRGSHIFKSVDGGQTWVESDGGYLHSAETAIHEIEIDPKDTSTVYIGTTEGESIVGNGIWKSTDQGRTWARANSGMRDDNSINVIVIHPNRQGMLLAGTYDGIYRSSDDARTWTAVTEGKTWDMEQDPTNPDVVYAATRGGILLSRDFGLTWEDVSADLPSGDITAIAVNCDGTAIYTGVSGSGVFVSIAESIREVPLDLMTGVQYGTPPTVEQSSRGGQDSPGGQINPANYDLTIIIAGDGMGTVHVGAGKEQMTCRSPLCVYENIQAAVVTLDAKPNADSTFSGWSITESPGTCTGTGSCELRMVRDTTVVATLDK